MVTGDEEIKWAYLIGPCFQLENTAGKPLTGGYIEVYIAGTRDKYYCASDFNGTLHPFQIPLDSLGSNIVLASPTNTYDVYVYNKFGSLVMSRYNVMCTNGSADISVTGFTSVISDGTLDVYVTGNSFIISAQELWDAVSGIVNDIQFVSSTLETVSGSLANDIQNVSSALDDVSGMLSGKKDIQVPYGATGSAIQTITSITQDEQGVIRVQYGDIEAQNPLTPGQYVSIENDVITVTGLQPEGDYLVSGDLEGYATEQFVTAYVEEHGGSDQVQSDWTETDTSSKAYILHKPPEKQLVAGANVYLTPTASSVIINAYGEYQAGQNISIDPDSHAISVTGLPTTEFVTGYVESAISGLTGAETYITSNDGTIIVNPTVDGQVTSFDLSVSGDVFDSCLKANGRDQFLSSFNDLHFQDLQFKKGDDISLNSSGQVVINKEGRYFVSVKGGFANRAQRNVDLTVTSTLADTTKRFQLDLTVTGNYDTGEGATYFDNCTIVNVVSAPYTIPCRLTYDYSTYDPSVAVFDKQINVFRIGSVGGDSHVVPVTGATYEAGWGINIVDDVISVDANIIPDVSGIAEAAAAEATEGLASLSQVSSIVQQATYNFVTEPYVTSYVSTQIDNAKEIYTVYWNVSTLAEIIQASVLDAKKVYLGVSHVTDGWTDIHYEVPLTRLVTPGQTVSEWYAEFVVPYTAADNSPKGVVFKVDATNTWSKYEFGQVQADWSVTATDSVSYIQNKPDLSGFVDESYVTGYVESQVSSLATESYVTAYVDSHVTGGISQVYVTGCVTGNGTESSPLAINYDDTLRINSISDNVLPMYNNYPLIEADSELAYYLRTGNTYHTVTFTFSGFTPSASSRTIVVNFEMLNSEEYTWLGGYRVTLAANATSMSVQINMSSAPDLYNEFDPAHSWIATLNVDNETWDSIYCTECTHNAPVDTTDFLSVKNPLPTAVSGDNGKVLGVTDTSGSIGWVEAGGGTEYTAGNYIDITNDVISVTGLQPAGDYLVSGDLEGYATDESVTAYVESQVSGLAPQVQSDWSVTATDAVDYIKNKPEIVEMDILPVSAGQGIAIDNVSGTIYISNTVTEDFVTGYVESQVSGIPTYSAGNCISLASDIVAWTTTAGITDIVSVAALPASPVSSVIYLIPEA